MQLIVSTELTTLTCPSCGGTYAISSEYKDEARKQGGFKQCWTCPYCKTSRGYGKSRHEEEKEQLEAEIASLTREKQGAEERGIYYEKEAEHFRKSRDALKGVLAKERKRVANGVCPRCNRSFTNLQRHMATKHPEHANADSDMANPPPNDETGHTWNVVRVP
jgi:uncharacterized Zn finger protein (UPF0148 family)